MNRNYLILIGLGIATIVAFLLINFLSGSSSSSSSTITANELQQEILDLESSLIEYEVIQDDQLNEIGGLKSLLEEKYDQITYMEQQIEELERQGKADASTIQTLREKLAKSKNLLINQYKVEINELVKDNSNLTQTLDSVVFATSEVEVRYQNQVDSLIALLNNCGGQAATSAPPVPKPEDSVPILRAENFSFKYQAGAGKTPTTFTGNVKQKQLNTLFITFDLKGNQLVPTEQKEIFLQLEDADGMVYSNPRLNYGGIINLNGQEVIYSRKAKVEYQNGLVSSVSVEFAMNDAKEFKKGRLRVKVLYKNEELGRAQFLII